MASPWLLYWTALATVNGRPVPPPSIAVNIVTSAHSSVATPGQFAAWLVAKHHNLANRTQRDMLLWHVAGSGLTIWLTTNWTTDEILLAADQVVRMHRPGKRCLRRARLTCK